MPESRTPDMTAADTDDLSTETIARQITVPPANISRYTMSDRMRAEMAERGTSAPCGLCGNPEDLHTWIDVELHPETDGDGDTVVDCSQRNLAAGAELRRRTAKAAEGMSGPDAATTSGQDGELTAERWRQAARRAYRRDRDLLDDAFAGFARTPDLGHLFAGVVHYLDRTSLLTLAGLPALLSATTASVERPEGTTSVTTTLDLSGDVDLTAQTVAAVHAHRDAFHEHVPVAEPGPGLQRSTAVADAGQRVLDIASIVTGRPTFVVAPSDHAYSLSVNPPEDWIGHRSTFAVLLRRGELLLGFTDGGSIHAFPQPEPVEVIVGGRVVTVRTTTGRVLIMDSWVEVYRLQNHASDRSPRRSLQTPPLSTAHAA